MLLKKRLMILSSISLLCIGCDQGTKILATAYLPRHEIYSYFHDVFRLGYVENVGAFLGLGNTLPDTYRFWLFVVVVGLLLGGLLIYLISSNKQNLSSYVGLSLVFSGGLSNFYDRATHDGAVVDFLNIGIGSLRTGIFNIADIAIMLGMVMVLVVSFRQQP